MPIVSLSTMWAQGRFQRLAEFAAAARRLGFSHIELSYIVPPEWLAELPDLNGIAVSSVHAPCPWTDASNGQPSSDLSLCSLDESERAEAVRFTWATIDLAAQAGAKAVVVHMGHVGDHVEQERQLRHWYEQGLAQSSEYREAQELLREQRAQEQDAYRDAALRSLLELAPHAADRGVRLGLENRVYYHELPSLEEMGLLLEAADPQVVGFWYDVGHAEMLHRLGFTPHQEWFRRYRDRLIGTHIHDVHIIRDHHVPGAGEVPWELVAQGLPESALRVCEIDQGNDEERMQGVLPFLRAQGIVG